MTDAGGCRQRGSGLGPAICRLCLWRCMTGASRPATPRRLHRRAGGDFAPGRGEAPHLGCARPCAAGGGRHGADAHPAGGRRPAGDLRLGLWRRRHDRRALEAGAADYIVKPYSSAELAARVGLALRRRNAPGPFRIGGLEVDRTKRWVNADGRERRDRLRRKLGDGARNPHIHPRRVRHGLPHAGARPGAGGSRAGTWAGWRRTWAPWRSRR